MCWRAVLLTMLVACCAGCFDLLPQKRAEQLSAMQVDPTPLARCKVAASASSPLVTEWPASEKAHLEGLASAHLVAVQYSGCELRLVEGCTIPGRYAWRRTTLAADVLEIQNADQLYAKLPVGAAGLEGELARSGRIAVRTTIAGQLRGDLVPSALPEGPGCADATHVISAISVGSFQMLSGTSDAASGGVSVAGIGAGARTSRRETVLREAGVREACAETTDQAPNIQCASPVQLFLVPLGATSRPASAVSSDPDTQARLTGVHIDFPAAADAQEVWTLRAPGGRLVCAVPCDAWVGPVSGYVLQREPRNGRELYNLNLPKSFGYPVGSRVTAEYRARRGNPELARLAMWASVPTGVLGVGLTAWGVVQAAGGCSNNATGGCFPGGGFLIGTGVFFMALGGAGTWWYLWSHDESFTTFEDLPVKRAALHFELMPHGIGGTF